MGAIGSFAVGAALGLLFTLAMAASNLSRIAKRPVEAAGLERLAPGATEWQPLASPDGGRVTRMWKGGAGKLLVSTGTRPFGAWWHDGRWEATTELCPQPRTHPTIPDTFWHPLPDGVWLTASAGTCAPALEPSRTVLPALPRCEAEQFQHRLRTAARLSDGHLLVVVQHLDGAHRAWRLAPGAAAWADAGALPEGAVTAELVAGFAGDALAVLGDGEMLRYDGQRWSALPRQKGRRLGWEGALAEDGAVLAAGGFEDTRKHDARVSWAITLAFLVAAVLAIRLLNVGLVGALAMAGGGCVGILGAVALFFGVWVFVLGPRF